MSDTPRTDSAEVTNEETDRLVGYVESAFARQLERELNEWRECAKEMHEVITTASVKTKSVERFLDLMDSK